MAENVQKLQDTKRSRASKTDAANSKPRNQKSSNGGRRGSFIRRGKDPASKPGARLDGRRGADSDSDESMGDMQPRKKANTTTKPVEVPPTTSSRRRLSGSRHLALATAAPKQPLGTVLTLPSEILARILSYLDVESIRAARSACKALARAATTAAGIIASSQAWGWRWHSGCKELGMTLDRVGLEDMRTNPTHQTRNCPGGANPYHAYHDNNSAVAFRAMDEDEANDLDDDLEEARTHAAGRGFGYYTKADMTAGRRVHRHCTMKREVPLTVHEARLAYFRCEGFLFSPEGVVLASPEWAALAGKRMTMFAEDMLGGTYTKTCRHFRFMINAMAGLGGDVFFRAETPGAFGQCETVERTGNEDEAGKLHLTCGYFTGGAITRLHNRGWPDMLRDDHVWMATPSSQECLTRVKKVNENLSIVSDDACYLSTKSVIAVAAMDDDTANEWTTPMTSDEQVLLLIRLLLTARGDENARSEHYIIANDSPHGKHGNHWFPMVLRLTAVDENKRVGVGDPALTKYNLGRIGGKGIDTRLASERPSATGAQIKAAKASTKRTKRLLAVVDRAAVPGSELTRIHVSAAGSTPMAAFPKGTSQKKTKTKKKTRGKPKG